MCVLWLYSFLTFCALACSNVNIVFYGHLGVFERAYESLRTSAPEQKEERAMLLEEWKEAERSFGEFGDFAAVQRKLPRKVKRKRAITAEDGTPAGYVHRPLQHFCGGLWFCYSLTFDLTETASTYL
jgi:hypothetical protein